MRSYGIAMALVLTSLLTEAAPAEVSAQPVTRVGVQAPRIVELAVSMPGVQEAIEPIVLHLAENQPGVIRLFERELALALVASVADEALGEVTLQAYPLFDVGGRFHYRESAGETLHAKVGFPEYLREGGVFVVEVTGISTGPSSPGPLPSSCQSAGGDSGEYALETRGNCCVTLSWGPDSPGLSERDQVTTFGACGCLVTGGGGGSCCSPRCCP